MDTFRSARQKKISQKQEKAVAKEMGGRTQAASGATRMGGGADVRAPGYRIECKYTEKSVYGIKKSDLHKLKEQAARTLEQPVMQLAFVDTRGRRTEFAITKAGNTVAYLCKAKSFLVRKELLQKLLLTNVPFAFRFDGDRDHWLIRHWSDFILEIKDYIAWKNEC